MVRHLDHPAQLLSMLLIQIDQRLAVAAAKPLEQVYGVTGWVVHDLAHTL